MLEAYRLLMAEVYELAGASRRTSDEMAREIGQTAARWHALSVVSDGPQTVPVMARRLGLTRQSVQRVVNALVESDDMMLLPNPDHQASPLVQLTKTGRETMTTLFARSDLSRAQLLKKAGVTERQLLDARKTLRALLDALI